MASSVMAMIALALGTLASTVELSEREITGRNVAAQHARVVVDRIERAIAGATANEQFPGFAVFSTSINGYTYPDTLVVWRPTSSAANPDGLPRFSELIVYAPNPLAPTELLEITSPSDTRTVPALSAASTWQTELNTLKTGNAATRVVLTNLMRTASAGTIYVTTPSGGSTVSQTMAAVRFETQQRPTATELANFRAGTVGWTALNWPQDRYGRSSGLCCNWCRLELQLVPGEKSRRTDPAGLSALGFFGSATTNFDINK